MDELVFGRSTIAIFQNMGLSYNNDATKSTQPTGEAPKSFEGCPFDLHSLKEEVITNPGIKAKVKPILLSFNGLPDSGKTAAVDYVRKTYTTEGVAIKDVRSEIAEEAAEGIHYYQFIAASSSVTKNLIINEFTKKSCFAPSILSAFNERFLSQGKVPHLNIDEIYDTSVFDQPDLDEHIHFIYQFLSRQDFIGKSKKAEQLSDQERRDTENLIKALPEGIAVVNVWDVTINKIVRHFLAALQGHLYNQHTWLFLDLEDDIESLTMPPEEGGLMSWRPHLHYLLRQCMISKDNEKERRGVCTIIGKHNGMQNGNLQMKVQALESKVRPLAKHIGIATLLEDKIKTINLKSHNSTHTLCQNFERVINETPYEEIPVVWVFLRSLFYRFDWKIIARDDLKAMAEKCGMDDESLKGFCKFYTSFGSIFDLSLVDPDYQFVIVKPVQFLRKLNDLLQNDKFRQTGIVSESACRDMFDGHMTAFMDALVSLNLAARVIKSNLELEPNELTENDIFYYIPTLRKMNKEQLNPKSIHVLTSIDTPHIFKQATFTKHFLRLRPQAKLVPSKYRNQTIINDTATGTIITLTSFSPATNLHLDKPSEEVCSCIVQVYNDIAKKARKVCSPCPSSGAAKPVTTVKYRFIKICMKNSDKLPPQSIPSSSYHVLPVRSPCSKCNDSSCDELLKAWNEALTKNPTHDSSLQQSTKGLKPTDVAEIAEKIASYSCCEIPIINQVFGTQSKENESKDKALIINDILLSWYKTIEDDNQPERVFASKILELGNQLSQTCASQENSRKIEKEFQIIAEGIDVYCKK